jgi:hypothetical protein
LLKGIFFPSDVSDVRGLLLKSLFTSVPSPSIGVFSVASSLLSENNHILISKFKF